MAHLDHAFRAIAEEVIHVLDFNEREGMRQQRCEINATELTTSSGAAFVACPRRGKVAMTKLGRGRVLDRTPASDQVVYQYDHGYDE